MNPVDQYFFAEINKLSLRSITEAFEFNIPLPKVILDTGFPDGLIAGFTLNPEGKSFNFGCHVFLPYKALPLQGTTSEF